jgi:hypothetical protein
MEESMDRYSTRYATLGSSPSKSTFRSTIGQGKSAPVSTAASQPINVAGSWHLEFSDGSILDLDLSQSGVKIFGRGSLTSKTSSQWAVASGEATGSNLDLEVVPAGGVELYAISMDISRLHLPGSYTVFRANSLPLSGNVMASRVVAGNTWSAHDTAKNAIGNSR